MRQNVIMDLLELLLRVSWGALGSHLSTSRAMEQIINNCSTTIQLSFYQEINSGLDLF